MMYKFSKFLFTSLTFFFFAAQNSAWSKSNSAKKSSPKIQSAMLYQRFEDENEFETYEENVEEIYDPLEKYNRKIYAFNDFLDRHFLEYVAKTYRNGIPESLRNSIRNFLINLSLPISAVNSLAQGKVDNGLATFSNFLINSTVGVAGVFDVAVTKGVRYRPEDFGQTLGHYGMKTGTYFIIPLFGPSTTRDLSGLLVDKSINPIEFNLLEFGGRINLIDTEYRLSLAAASGIDKRESLIDIIDDVRIESFDPYATIRSAYLQKRISDIKF